MDEAPGFTLKDKDGNEHSLSDYGRKVVYFYPKDDTPGCTTEARQFTELKDKIEKHAKIIGISGGDEESKAKFCKKHDLDILLLADADFEVAKAYGVYGPKKFMGKEFKGITRSTFIIDEENNIEKRWSKVKAKGHAQEVLEYLEGN